MTFNWVITSISGEKFAYEGQAVTHTFTEVGLYKLKLVASKLSDNGKLAYQELEQALDCKYVRREIRSLLLEERQDLLKAMSVLWKVEAKEGFELYGKDYIDIWSINRVHYRAATDNCDHFHDGMGFLVAHSAITLVFEQSLRLVNPKLSVPYWDFTIEGTTVNVEYGGDLNRILEASPIFTEDYFGDTDPADLMVKNGLWGNTSILRVSNEDRLAPNVYGLMRSPWDVNNRPYLTRGLGAVCSDLFLGFSWPTCQMHYDLNVEKTSFYDWTWESMYYPHGTVHIWIGGLIDCEGIFDRLAEVTGDRIANDLRSLAYVLRKIMFSRDYWRCKGTVDMETTPGEVMASGMCGCLDYDLSNDDHVQFLLNNIPPLDTMTGGLDREQKRAVMTSLCEGVQSTGEQLGPSSPIDPSFWPTHPTMERLYQKAQLSGVMTDVSWPQQGTWRGTDGTIYDVVMSISGDTCLGHNATDVFPYDLVASGELDIHFDIIEEGKLVRRTGMTNVELLEAFDPRSQALPYVYDNMDWTHCLQEGVDFSKMGTTTSTPKQDTYTVFKAGEEPLEWYVQRMAQITFKSN